MLSVMVMNDSFILYICVSPYALLVVKLPVDNNIKNFILMTSTYFIHTGRSH